MSIVSLADQNRSGKMTLVSRTRAVESATFLIWRSSQWAPTMPRGLLGFLLMPPIGFGGRSSRSGTGSPHEV